MKKKIRIAFNSPAVLWFVICCFLATLAGVISGGRITETIFMTYHSSLLNPLTYIRFFTHVFGHSGWDHFFNNAAYILLVGPMLEEKYGTKIIVEIMVITALATGLVNYIFFWNVGLCGASGIVFAFILLASFTSFKKGEIPLTFILVATIYIGQQVYEGVFVQDNISNMAHIVGGLIGSIMGYSMNKKSSIW